MRRKMVALSRKLDWFLAMLVVAGTVPAFGAQTSGDQMSDSGGTTYLFLQLTGLSVHTLTQTYGQQYPLKFDDRGVLSVSPGVVLGLDVKPYGNRHLFFRNSAGGFSDSAGLPAGYLHTGVGYQWRLGNHTLGVEAGPSVYFRSNWRRQPWFDGRPYFERAPVQMDVFNIAGAEDKYEIFPLVGVGLDHSYQLSERIQIHTTLVPTIFVFTVQSGIRVRL